MKTGGKIPPVSKKEKVRSGYSRTSHSFGFSKTFDVKKSVEATAAPARPAAGSQGDHTIATVKNFLP
jgi:hypothetical protein